MAVAISALDSVLSGTPDTSITSASFTPAADSLLLVPAVAAQPNGQQISDSVGLSWSSVTVSDGAQAVAVFFWALVGPSPTSMTVTGSNTHGSTFMGMQPFQVTGMDTNTPIRYTGSVSGGDSMTLDGPPASDSLVVSVVLIVDLSSGAVSWTDPAGYSNLVPYTELLPSDIAWQAADLNGGASSTVTWTGGDGNQAHMVGLAIEIPTPIPVARPNRIRVRSVAVSTASSLW